MSTTPVPSRDCEKTTIELASESLEIGKRELETGRVRVKKIVHEEEKHVEELLRRTDVEVERVPVNRVVTEPLEARYEGDTLVIPVLEEVLVVQKQWLLKEEVRIRRTSVEAPHTERVVLRSEEAIVEREGPIHPQRS
jgi:uncharacterized protein (TIGR02271 family)